MNSSGTFKSDIKKRISNIDDDSFKILTDSCPDPAIKQALIDVRTAILDYLIAMIDPEKAKKICSEEDTSMICYTKYLNTMATLAS